jgi:uncharacterized membrane protein YccC
MKWQLPWVSRRAYEQLWAIYQSTITQRDQQMERADRMCDQMLDRFSFQPVSAPVRTELKEAATALEEYIASTQVEDQTSGMISEEVLALVDEVASDNAKHGTN